MSYKIPSDPNLLYSFVNMMLRDRYSSLDEFCICQDVDMDELKRKLESSGYVYDAKTNQFK